MLEYVLVFDAAAAPLIDWTDAGPVVAVAAVAVAFWARGRRGPGGRRSGFFGSAVAVAGLSVAVVTLCGTLIFLGSRDTRYLRDRLRNGDYVLVEGRVENFVPGDRGGHRDEAWTVRSGGRTYAYRYRWSNRVPGFHQSAGPIREGMHVRLADVDGYIARLEVEQ